MSLWLEILVSLFLLLGSGFVLVGAIGLHRLPDFFTRLHAPTKASTLGVSAILLAATVFFTIEQHSLSLHELLIILFLWLTAPISAMLMATLARHYRKVD